jgi:hypothetical protein
VIFIGYVRVTVVGRELLVGLLKQQSDWFWRKWPVTKTITDTNGDPKPNLLVQNNIGAQKSL